MTKYKHNSGDDKIRRLVESQEQEIANRSKIVDAYMAQLESRVEATKEGSNLFNGFFRGILKLLPTTWADFIQTFLLVAGIIVAVPTVYLLFLITRKCLSLLCWCYAPILSRIPGFAQGTRSVGSNAGGAVESFVCRIRPGVKSRYYVISLNENIRQENMELLPRRHHSRTTKPASNIFENIILKCYCCLYSGI